MASVAEKSNASATEWVDAELFCPFQHEQALLYEHAECVATRAFLKMVNLPFSLEQRPNAEFMSPTGQVPFLKLQNVLTPGFMEIVNFVAQKGIKLTNTLSDAEIADMNALMALIYDNLLTAEKAVCWKDSPNYHSVTKGRYGSVYPVPLKWILPPLRKREVLLSLADAGQGDKCLEDTTKDADLCFQALSVRLGNNKYLMGSEPTELDALAFGHLFSILTTELPSMTVNSTLRKYDNLIKYCCAIDEEFFKL